MYPFLAKEIRARATWRASCKLADRVKPQGIALPPPAVFQKREKHPHYGRHCPGLGEKPFLNSHRQQVSKMNHIRPLEERQLENLMILRKSISLLREIVTTLNEQCLEERCSLSNQISEDDGIEALDRR